jgi:hypothetical protein
MSRNTCLAARHGGPYVDVDDLQLLGEVGLQERPALAQASVQRGRVERAADLLDLPPQLLDAVLAT